MGLYERLAGTEDPKLPVHDFMAAVGEVERGKQSESTLATWYSLSAGEQTELATLVAKVRTPLEGYPFSGNVTLTNVGTTYDATDPGRSLPFVYLQRAGVTRIDIELRVNKVGTGTQEWALRDDTNSVEVITTESGQATANTTGNLSDTGGAGHKTLNASRTFPTPLSPQVVKLRLRCKSTTGADDPVFLQGAILLFRVDKLTAVELHELLILAEHERITVAQLKSRLGVS